MGCFNVACNLTSHSMYNDNAVFVGLIRSPYSHDYPHNFHMCYTTAIFTPILLPIYGRLDTYGRLEDIKRTKYVEFLESKNIPIEQIFENKIPEDNILHGLSGTYISQCALDYCRNTIYDDSGNNIQKKSWTKERLLLAGISDITQTTNLELSHDTYKNTIFKGEQVLTFEEGVKYFIDKNILSPNQALEISSKSNFRVALETHFNAPSRLLRAQGRTLGNLNFDRISTYDTHQFFRSLFNNLYLVPEYAFILEEYYRNWEDFSDEFEDLEILENALSFSNKFWHPQSNGFQHGSIFQEYNLASLQKELSGVSERIQYVKAEEDIEELEYLMDCDFFKDNSI